MADLRNPKVVSVQLTIEYPKPCGFEQSSKLSQLICMHFMAQPYNIFEYKKVDIKLLVELRKKRSVVFGQLSTRISCLLVTVTERKRLTGRTSNQTHWMGFSGQFVDPLDKEICGYL